MLDSTPAPAAFSTDPAVNTVSPARMSSATGRTEAPAVTDLLILTRFGIGCSQSSTITTASAPSGIGAPVMMRSASPAPTCHTVPSPAASVPMTRNSAGTFAMSLERTAKPSTAVLANGGTFSVATTSRASTSPAERSQAIWRSGSRETEENTRCCASLSGITSRTVSGTRRARLWCGQLCSVSAITTQGHVAGGRWLCQRR